jgi:hypothetical protein
MTESYGLFHITNGHLKKTETLTLSYINNNKTYFLLRWAACHGLLKLVRYLVSRGVDFHQYDEAAVRWAYRNGYVETVCYLVSQGASLSRFNTAQCRHIKICMKHYERREILAASKIYFWWIPKCYRISSASGVRMALVNVKTFEDLCAEEFDGYLIGH